jgi:methyltransferase (TIGR00027 family)
MKRDKPSQTALFVAFVRALAERGFTTVPTFSDPFAASLLSPSWAWMLRRLTPWLERAGPGLRARVIAKFDFIPLRTRAIDSKLEEALESGCRQAVLLGAGLDTRAYRLQSLAGCTVYEVDHPATQKYKRDRTSALGLVAGSLVYVPVDFERDMLCERLAALGHRGDAPTVWVCEGVAMYLTEAALRGTLRDAAALSAPGSVLLLHYHEPARREPFARRVLLAVWGEPQIGTRSAERMTAEVRAAGFDVESDSGAADWARELGAMAHAGETTAIMRLIVAHRH